MTPSAPRTASGEDGTRRPLRLAARAVVVARDPAVRDGWARTLEASGMDVLRCVGPTISCVLDRIHGRCPLLADAGIALYHEAVLSEQFIAKLQAAHPRAMVIATRDRHRADGDHEPAMSHVIVSPTV